MEWAICRTAKIKHNAVCACDSLLSEAFRIVRESLHVVSAEVVTVVHGRRQPLIVLVYGPLARIFLLNQPELKIGYFSKPLPHQTWPKNTGQPSRGKRLSALLLLAASAVPCTTYVLAQIELRLCVCVVYMTVWGLGWEFLWSSIICMLALYERIPRTPQARSFTVPVDYAAPIILYYCAAHYFP